MYCCRVGMRIVATTADKSTSLSGRARSKGPRTHVSTRLKARSPPTTPLQRSTNSPTSAAARSQQSRWSLLSTTEARFKAIVAGNRARGDLDGGDSGVFEQGRGGGANSYTIWRVTADSKKTRTKHKRRHRAHLPIPTSYPLFTCWCHSSTAPQCCGGTPAPSTSGGPCQGGGTAPARTTARTPPPTRGPPPTPR